MAKVVEGGEAGWDDLVGREEERAAATTRSIPIHSTHAAAGKAAAAERVAKEAVVRVEVAWAVAGTAVALEAEGWAAAGMEEAPAVA